MARLPVPGGDNGNWGTILNDYLSQIHKPDGTLKDHSVTSTAIADDAVTATAIQDGTIMEAQLDTALQTKLNQPGDWDTLSNKPAVVAAGSDQASARTAIGAGTSNSVINTVTSSVTLDSAANTQYIVMLESGAVPTLPAAAGNGSVYIIKNIHSSSITVLTSASETIEGQAGYLLSANESIMVVSDGTNWRII